MLCLNVPRKVTAAIQVWVCMVLIVASLVLSFSPIITLDLLHVDNAEEIKQAAEEMVGTEAGEIPEKLNISAPTLYSGIRVLVKTIGVTMHPDDAQKKEEVRKMLVTDDGKLTETAKNMVWTVSAIAMLVKDSVKANEGEKSNILGTILNTVVEIVCLMYLLLFTLLVPIIYVFVALSALILVLKNLSDSTAIAGKMGKKLIKKISFLMLFMLAPCVLPTVSYGSGTMVLFILALLSVLVGFVVSRLHRYTPTGIKYLNVVQGVSILSIAGFLIFFFNITKAGVFRNFVSGKWAMTVANVIIAKENKQTVVSNGYIVDAILILVAALLVLATSLSYLTQVLKRFSCTETKINDRANDSQLVTAIFMLFIVILPKYVQNAKNYYANITDASSERESFLSLSDAQNGALNAAMVGLIIILISEIALIVLKKVFCKDVSKEEMAAVLSNTYANEESAAPAQPAEAPAEAVKPEEPVAEATEEKQESDPE